MTSVHTSTAKQQGGGNNLFPLLCIALLMMVFAGCSCSILHRKTGTPDTPISDSSKETLVKWVREWNPDSARMMDDVRSIAAAPHPFGSNTQQHVGDLISKRATDMGLRVLDAKFDAVVPLRSFSPGGPYTEQHQGRNILAMPAGSSSKPCMVLLASHYDSKLIPGISFVGANDSGSSSAALLEIMNGAQNPALAAKLHCDLAAVWFDGEEAVLDGWDDAMTAHPARIVDHTYGSRNMAESLHACGTKLCLPEALGGQELRAVILLDMIGSPDVTITREANSSERLNTTADEAATALGFSTLFSSVTRPVEDDHKPFLDRGVPAIDLIDFEHTALWHQAGDSVDALSDQSLVISAKLALLTAAIAASSPTF